jgi:hypothetical protein
MKKYIQQTLVVVVVLIACHLDLSAAATTIQIVQDPSIIAEPWTSFVRKGDFIVSDGKATAVVSASPRTAPPEIWFGYPEAAGAIIGFLPEGASKRAATLFGVPAVSVAGLRLEAGQVTVTQDGGGILVRLGYEGAGGVKLEVRTRYAFALESRRISVSSEVRNAGRAEVKGLSFGLGANAYQNYNFRPYQAQSFPKLNFSVWQRPDHVLGWYSPNPTGSAANPVPGRLGAGQVYRASYVLLTGTDPAQVAERLFALAGERAERVPFEFTGFDGLTEIVIKETVSGVVFYRAFMDKPAPRLDVPLPRGTYSLIANYFPAAAERDFKVDEGTAKARPLTITAPKVGKVRISLTDRAGEPVLGKVSFIGLSPDKSPYFAPENPVVTGRRWEQAKNSVYPLREKLDLAVPAGTYLVTASRGPEYTREERVVEIFDGENPPLDLRIDRAVYPSGLISVDPHMHTQFSDGTMLVAERLKSAAGEGLDVVISADHNTITDYRPDLERLGIGGELAVILGEEVTAPGGSIHYNAYPVARLAGVRAGGAISVADVTPDVLFGLTRAKDPGAIIQVNHPRSRGLGYFLFYALDAETAATAKAPFSMDFDVMEIMNGSKFGGANRASTEDWFHLLNRGYGVKAVGSSDAHNIDGGETGYSRTYVQFTGRKGAGLDQAAVVKAIKEGRSFVSNGPIVKVTASGGKGLGDLVRARKGKVALDVRVESAPWVDVSEVRLVVNGERQAPLEMEGAYGPVVRFNDDVDLTLDRDAWISVEVRGTRSLFPVLQQRAAGGAAIAAAFPYAMTNPIYFDVDGDGKWTPPLAEKVKIK